MSPLLLLEPNALIGTQHHTHTLKPQNPNTALVTAYRSGAHRDPPTLQAIAMKMLLLWFQNK